MGPTGVAGLDWTIAFAAFVTASGIIWRKAIKPVVEGVEELRDRYDAVPDLDARMAALEAMVDRIDQRTKQLEPNGGSSLYDKVAHHGVVIGEMYDDLRPMVTAIGTLAAKDSRARQRAPRKEKQ